MNEKVNLNIVLYQPEIPQNTGNIMRTCVAFNAVLHLIEPLGFSLTESKLKRCGLDYIKYLKYKRYVNWNDFIGQNKPQNIYYFTRYGMKNISELDLSKIKGDCYFVFGRESTGIPKDILKENLSSCIRIPTTNKVRALNLSNTVAVALYEAVRQLHFPDLSLYEPDNFKGNDFLVK